MTSILKSMTGGSTVSVLISFINFLTFVILPSFVTYKSSFAVFSEANIYSGFYNAIIATSAGSVALLVLNKKNYFHTRLYLMMSLIFMIFFIIWSDSQETRLIIAYALLSLQNYSISSQRYLNDRFLIVSKLAFQPVTFLLSIILQESLGIKFDWTTLFLVCSIASLVVCRREIVNTFSTIMRFKDSPDTKRLIYLVLACSSLPLLVQMDLPFIKINNLDIAYYSIVHKIIYSIPIAIVGVNVPILLSIFEKGDRIGFVKMSLSISLITSFIAAIVMFLLDFMTDISFELSLALAVIFIISTYSFLNILLSVLAIITSSNVFFIVFSLIIISCLGYFFYVFEYFIIYKGILFMIYSLAVLKIYFFKKIYE